MVCSLRRSSICATFNVSEVLDAYTEDEEEFFWFFFEPMKRTMWYLLRMRRNWHRTSERPWIYLNSVHFMTA